MKALAFDNSWHILALIWGLLAVRAFTTHLPALRKYRPALMELVDSLLVAVLLVFLLLRPFVVQAFFIPSESMVPTLLKEDRILVNKFIYFFREPQPGDIIVFVSPPQADSDQRDFIKRVVGLPGDRLSVHQGVLHRNGNPVSEPYLAEPMRYGFILGRREYVVPEGHLFVLGDNRNVSRDSHEWGSLPRENVLGKAFFIFYPPSRLGLLH